MVCKFDRKYNAFSYAALNKPIQLIFSDRTAEGVNGVRFTRIPLVEMTIWAGSSDNAA